jgi:formate hydrogenlyase subunit 4
MKNLFLLLQPLLALVLAPLLLGIINKTKAFYAGRTGQPLLQAYWDLWKLLGKGAVYSRSTTWIFRLSPSLILASMITAIFLMPSGGILSPLAFSGDLILFAYLLGLARFFTVAAALDTGSAFEGMGASREVLFSALAEPALFLALAALAGLTHTYSLSAIYAGITPEIWKTAFPALLLLVAALFVVFLAENSRIPVDDPNTHLELTMIHEVMVLDHSGPDFAFIQYAASLKLWLLGSMIVGILVPLRGAGFWLEEILFLFGMGLLAVVVGYVESSRARLFLPRVPKFIGSAAVLAALALLLVLR